jgi:hypothetical protein
MTDRKDVVCSAKHPAEYSARTRDRYRYVPENCTKNEGVRSESIMQREVRALRAATQGLRRWKILPVPPGISASEMEPALLIYQFVLDNLAKMTSLREVKRQPAPVERAQDLLREWRGGFVLQWRRLAPQCTRALLFLALQQAEKNI